VVEEDGFGRINFRFNKGARIALLINSFGFVFLF